MKVSEPQPCDQIEHNDRQNNPDQHGRHNRRDPSRRDVERRMDRRPVPRRNITVRRGVEVAPEPFRDDCDQAKLQIGSPAEWPEEELPGALNGKRNGIRGGNESHLAPLLIRHSVSQSYEKPGREVP